MKIINCQICGQLVAALEKGSKIKTGAVMICHDCRGRDEEVKDDSRYSGDVQDFLREFFRS